MRTIRHTLSMLTVAAGLAACGAAAWAQFYPFPGPGHRAIASATDPIYGGWTGGGSTTDFSSCTGSDRTAVQAALDALATNGTLRFTCVASINDGVHFSGTNKRVTATGGGGILSTATSPPNSNTASHAILYVHDCTNCLVDHITFNMNNSPAEGIAALRLTNSSLQNNTVFNQGFDATDPPPAGIRADIGTDNWFVSNTVHDLGSSAIDGTRGIWIGTGESDKEIRPHILNNTVYNVGHTGIVSESQAPTVTGNTVTNAFTNGTGFKFIPRGSAAVDAIWDDNTVDTTANGGIMLEGSGVFPTHIYIRRWQFKNVGGVGTSFGGIYISGSLETHNVYLSDSTFTNCKRTGNVNFGFNINYTNNTILSGSNVLAIENTADGVFLTNSGTVSIGSGSITNVFVNGVQIAHLDGPGPRTFLAALRLPPAYPW